MLVDLYREVVVSDMIYGDKFNFNNEELNSKLAKTLLNFQWDGRRKWIPRYFDKIHKSQMKKFKAKKTDLKKVIKFNSKEEGSVGVALDEAIERVASLYQNRIEKLGAETVYHMDKGLALLYRNKIKKAEKHFGMAKIKCPFEDNHKYGLDNIILFDDNAKEISEALRKVYSSENKENLREVRDCYSNLYLKDCHNKKLFND